VTSKQTVRLNGKWFYQMTVWGISDWQCTFLLGATYPIRYGWVCINDTIYLAQQLRDNKQAWCVVEKRQGCKYVQVTSHGYEHLSLSAAIVTTLSELKR